YCFRNRRSETPVSRMGVSAKQLEGRRQDPRRRRAGPRKQPGVVRAAQEPGPLEDRPLQLLVGPAAGKVNRGVPPRARGIRNTGEQAMLVVPEHACGVYIGFVGPA